MSSLQSPTEIHEEALASSRAVMDSVRETMGFASAVTLLANIRRERQALAEVLDPGCTQRQRDGYLDYKAEACKTEDRTDRAEGIRMRGASQALDAVFGDPTAGRE